MRRLPPLALTLLLAPIALAAPPALTVTPAAPKPGDVVTVAGKVPLTFSVRGVGKDVLSHPNRRAVTFVLPDVGGVTVVAAGTMPVNDLDNVAVVTVGGDGAGPGPGPAPQPDPVDNTPTSLRIYLIEETSEAVGTRGAMFTNRELAARVKDKGHRWRVVDKDVAGVDGKPPADLAPYLKAAAGKPYPTVFLVDDQGKDRTNGGVPAPAKAADFLALIQKYGG